jgi:hypothetical protein
VTSTVLRVAVVNRLRIHSTIYVHRSGFDKIGGISSFGHLHSTIYDHHSGIVEIGGISSTDGMSCHGIVGGRVLGSSDRGDFFLIVFFAIGSRGLGDINII